MKKLLITSLVIASVALAGEAVELKRQDKVGDVKKYAVHMDFDVQGQQGDFSADVTQTVESIDSETKESKVKHEMANGAANVGGQTMEQNVPAYFAYIGPNNWPSKVEGDAASASTLRFARSLSPAFSSAPLEIKEGKAKWTFEVKADADKGLAGWKQESTYLGHETQNGEDCAKIEFQLKETEGDQAIDSKGTAWVRPTDGTLVKLQADIQNMPIQGFVLNAKYTINLQK